MTHTKPPFTSSTVGANTGAPTGPNTGPHTSSKARAKIDAETLDQLVELERQDRAQARCKRQNSDPMAQMSVRMNEDVYRRFRALCRLERRTNGGMLQEMLEQYLADQGIDPDILT